MKYEVFWDNVLIGIIYYDFQLGYKYLPNLANIEELKESGLLDLLVNKTQGEWSENLPPFLARRLKENTVGSATDKLVIKLSI